MAENVVAGVMDKFKRDLEPHVLQDISEISGDKSHHSSGFRIGSDASVIELNWHGTCCVGKVLHPVFFQDSEPSGMEHILTRFCKEINLLRGLKHPNIVQFLGLYYRHTSPIPIMVMEKMECSLTELLSTYKKGSIPEDKVYGILIDVLKGLVYLHEVKGVAHRDLSSNNILVTSYLCAKIADLGSARVLDKPGGWNTPMQLTMQPGTQDFMPPEALEDPPQYGLSVDVFSFGCVIIHLIMHQWPKPIGQTFKGKIISEFERRKRFIEQISYDQLLFLLIGRCLKNDPISRPSSKDLLKSLVTKQKLQKTDLQDFITGLQYNDKIIEDQKRKILFGVEELKRKDAAVKGLQQILKEEHQLHQKEKLALQEDHNANQQKIHELSKRNKILCDKVGKLTEKCENAETEYAILKSLDLNSHEELQKYKEKVILLEQEIRAGKQTEADLYKEWDEVLKDFEDISSRYILLQNEYSELKLQRSTTISSGIDNFQELDENAILKSTEELQSYKDKVISLEQDIRRGKQTEADLYKELDEALKDLEDLSSRYKSLQNENSELKLGHSSTVYSDVNDSQLVQELNHKNKQVEILHGQIKSYADSLDREKRRVALLTMENQHFHQQLQSIPTLSQVVPPVPPHSPAHHNKTQPMPNAHRGWEGQIQTPNIVMSRDAGSSHLMPERHLIEPSYHSESHTQKYSQYDAARAGYHQFNVPNSHPQDRSRTTPHFSSDPYGEAAPLDPCPLCGKRFATTDQLTMHAASCNSQF